MHIVLAGFIVGVRDGLTGAGGRALMTPILVLAVGCTRQPMARPSAAVTARR